MSRSGFSISALLAKDHEGPDDVLSTEDTRKRTSAPGAVDWLSYGGSLDGPSNGDGRRQLGGLPLHRSYDSPGVNSLYNNLQSGYDSGFGNAFRSSASASDLLRNEKSDGWYSSDVGRNSSLDLERSRPSPYFGDILSQSSRLEHSTGGEDKEEDELEKKEEDRNSLIRLTTGHVQRRIKTITSHHSTKPHADGRARPQQHTLENSTISQPWEREKFENNSMTTSTPSSLTTSTPASNAPIRRPWEVSPVHNTHPLDISADNSSYLGQVSQDSGHPSFETQSMGPYDVFRSAANASTIGDKQELEDSQEENHIATKKVKNAPRTNTIFSDETVEVMETWYVANYDKPYPTDEQIHLLSTQACLTVRQARKWLANRRVRSHNTLAYNNNVHPKRARRLEKNKQAMLGLAATLSQNGNEGVNIPSVNVSLTPITHGMMNSVNRAGELSANIQESFLPRAPGLHVSQIRTRMDDTSNFPRLSFSSALSHTEFNQASGYRQRSALELNSSTSTPSSSFHSGLFHQQFQDPQHQQQFMRFGNQSLPALAVLPTYLSYNNYPYKEPRY